MRILRFDDYHGRREAGGPALLQPEMFSEWVRFGGGQKSARGCGRARSGANFSRELSGLPGDGAGGRSQGPSGMVRFSADELEQFAEGVLPLVRDEESGRWRSLFGGAGLVGLSVGDCADAGADYAEHCGDVFGGIVSAVAGLA